MKTIARPPAPRRAPARLCLAACGLALTLTLVSCEKPPAVRPAPVPGATDTPTAPEGDLRMAARPLGLKPDEYWSDPWKNLRPLTSERVSAREPMLLIDVPEHVPLGARDTAPLLAVYADTSESVVMLPYPRRALATAVNLDTNTLEVGTALNVDGPDDTPKEPPSPGFMAVEYDSDLFTTGAVPKETGRYIVTVILRDKVSNRLRMDVGDKPTNFKDEEVQKFLREQRAKIPPADVEPAEDAQGVVYGEGAGCPPIPTKPGIALSADRVVVFDGKSPAVLHASFRLPIFPNEALHNAKDHPGIKPRAGRAAPTGIARISLLLVGGDSGWDVLSMTVPTFAKLEGTPAEPIAVGYLRINLLAQDSLNLSPQTYFIYAFSGESFAGPVPMALVPEAALPRKP